MHSLHIGLDFDGVICDCGQLKSVAAERLFGVNIPAAEFKKELVVGRGLLTTEQYRFLQKEIYGSLELGMAAEPVPGMKDKLARLRADGHHVRVITSRTDETLDVARHWTARHGLTLEFTGVGQGAPKTEAVRGCDLYVDDDLDKLQPLVGVVPHLYLFSWGYNRHVDATNVAARVASWEELYATAAALSRSH